jgi:DNA repair photolyase
MHEGYRYALGLTSQFYFCGIPFRLDTSPKCSLNCSYCFAMTRGGRRTNTSLLASPSIIKNKLARIFNQRSTDIIGDFINANIPIHFGGMSDPFCNERVTKNSLELLKILSDFHYPTVISTKNTQVLLNEDVIRILKNHSKLLVQISFSVIDKKLSNIIEPNVPNPQKRINTISILAKEGINIICRLQPLFPNHLEEIENELIPKLAEIGINHIVTEFLKIPVERNISLFDDLYKSLSMNYLQLYRDKNALLVGREWLLPIKVKFDLNARLVETAHMYHMTFGYGDYGLNHLSDTDTCCGFDKFPGFINLFKMNYSYIIKNSRTNVLYYQDYTSSFNHSIRMYMNSQCRGDNLNRISDFLHDKWNRPGTINAPDTFLGITWEGEIDEHGDCIYIKKRI